MHLSEKKEEKSLICSVCQYPWCKYSRHGGFHATNGLTAAQETPEYLTIDSCELVFLLNKQTNKTTLENPQKRNSVLTADVQSLPVSRDPVGVRV